MTSSALEMPVLWSDRHRGHAPGVGYWLGIPVPGDDEPERGDDLRDALIGAGATINAPIDHGDAPLRQVHADAFLEFLATAYERWVSEGHLDDPGQPLVVPYVFALPQLTSGRTPREPSAIRGLAGRFAVDTMTLIGAGSYDAARAAVDCALSASDEVLGGASAAYAAVRPPGHHAGRDFYGGSCYLNSVACAAQYLRDRDVARVAIIDIDAHHGNGTQEIFYDRGDIWFGSLHVDPGEGWFPHFVGFGDECGVREGTGANVNLALPGSTSELEWLDSLRVLVDSARTARPEVLVVSLGVDTAADDPNSPFNTTAAGFTSAGEILAELGVPTVFVQEGGYNLETFGGHVVATLKGFEDAG